jgi:hypothetical protein
MIARVFILALFIPQLIFSHSLEFKGILVDQVTHAPVRNAHLKVRNSSAGTVSSPDGTFSLVIGSLPVTIDFSCIGYENLSIEISTIPGESRTIYLKPTAYNLGQVTITDKPAVALYKDEDYSVLDYEFLDDNLMLVVFRYQLKRAEIILMTTDGDTLTVEPVPSSPAMGLFKDVLSNIHYLTIQGDAFQALYAPALNQLTFPFSTTHDTIMKFLGQFRFRQGDRLWFQEDSPIGFMTDIGFYSRKEGRRNIRRISDSKAMKTFYTESWYYHTDRPVPEPIDENERRAVDADGIAYKHFYHEKGCGELYSISDTMIAFFNFCENRIELLDTMGQIVRTTEIGFHLEKSERFITDLTGSLAGTDEWSWDHTLVQDTEFRKIYAGYGNNGYVRLRNVDLFTGRVTASAQLPFEFPEKIKIFKGEVYFLYRGPGGDENRKLYKMDLR